LLNIILIQGNVLADASGISIFCHGKCRLVVALAAFPVAPFLSNVKVMINPKIESNPLREVQCLYIARVQEFS